MRAAPGLCVDLDFCQLIPTRRRSELAKLAGVDDGVPMRLPFTHQISAGGTGKSNSAVDAFDCSKMGGAGQAEVFLVYTVGLWAHSRAVLDVSTWYALPGGRWQLTPAGYWCVFVSLPLFPFILLRWYVGLFIWFRFLWQVSRIDLNLIPTQPDHCAGLAFLGKSAYAFGPILFAQGAIVAGVLATRIFYHGENLLSFKLQIGGFIAFFVLAILGPLLMFTPRMARAKRKGLADYGVLAQRYVESFEQKWVRNFAPSAELLGAADIESLADLGNSYAIVQEMRPIPFGLQDISRLAAAAAAPFLPLLLTVFSPEELIMRLKTLP
jgi:hypothetical protein